MRYYRVTFGADGKVVEVAPVQGPKGSAEWLVVQAANEADARKKATLLYCARKKRERIAKLYAEGRCHCGRKQDVAGQKCCSVCIERMKGYREKRRKADEAGVPPAPRDEAARIVVMQERVRDRRNELRLETLLEVRQWWIEAPNMGRFAERLATEIRKASGQTEATTAAACPLE